MILRRFVLPLLAVALLGACADKDEAEKITGDRIAVLKPADALKADESAGDVTLTLGDMPAFTKKPEEAWHSSIGSGSEDRRRLISTPVVAVDTVFTIDTRADVRAFALSDGSQKWRQDLAPEDADEKIFGGGLAVDGDELYATTGYGEVLALNAADGKVQWRSSVPDVLRAAPAVADGRVYVMTASHLYAFDAASGAQLWVHSGIAEMSTILGAATPAPAGDTVLAAYNSGELYAVRAQTGKTLWDQSLAANKAKAGTPALSDINAAPQVLGEHAYAISNGGRMMAIDMRSGNPEWDADVGGVNPPVISGEAVFVLADGSALATLDSTTGRAVRVTQLPRYKDKEEKKGAIIWSGPVLAEGVLWLVNNQSQLVGFDATSNERVFKGELPGKALLPPILAGKTLIVLTDDGELVAYR